MEPSTSISELLPADLLEQLIAFTEQFWTQQQEMSLAVLEENFTREELILFCKANKAEVLNLTPESNEVMLRIMDVCAGLKTQTVTNKEDLSQHNTDQRIKRSKNSKEKHIHIKFKRTFEIPSYWLNVDKLELDPFITISHPNKEKVTYGVQLRKMFLNDINSNKIDVSKIKETTIGYDNLKVRFESEYERDTFSTNFKTELLLQVPELRDPIIQIDNVTKEESWTDWLNRFKEWNKLETNSRISWSGCDQNKWGKWKVKLLVESKIRTMIAANNGRVSLGLQQKEITDFFKIIQCNNCKRFGHTRQRCRFIPNCGYCNGTHLDCKEKKGCTPGADRYCSNCEKTGHHVWSHTCPHFLKNLKSELEQVNYTYQFVILDKFRNP